MTNKEAATLYQDGLAAYESGDYPKAIELLGQITEAASLPSTLARFYLGQAHQQLGLSEMEAGRFAQAASHLAKAREINPDSSNLSCHLARCYALAKRFDRAAAELERDQDAGRGDDTLPIRLAHALARDGQIHRGIDTLRDAIRNSPNRADLHFHLGVLHASIDEYAVAREHLETAAEMDPRNAEIAEHLGLAYGALGDVAAASRALGKAQRLAPANLRIAWLCALAAQAATDAGHAIQHTPARPAARELSEASIVSLGEAILAEPDFVEAFLCLPQSEVDGEIFALLAATLQRALERHPDYADLHYHCSRVYDRLGRTEAAIESAQAAITLNPRYVQALITLARLYGKTNKNVEAIDRLHEAITCGGDYPDVHYLLGELYRGMGRREEAGRSFRRALELNANFRPAREGLKLVGAA